MNSLRLFSTAAVYGLIAFLAFCAISTLAWRLFPYPTGADQLLRTQVWLLHVTSEKIGGILLGCVIAFLAARAYRPSWKLGVLTGVLAAVVYQIFTIVLYLTRFGFHAYTTYHTFIQTMFSTVALAGLFSFVAVWRQYRRELHHEA
jgi:hypothetical protein